MFKSSQTIQPEEVDSIKAKQHRPLLSDWIQGLEVWGSYLPLTSLSGSDLSLARASAYTKLRLMVARLRGMLEFWSENEGLSGPLITELR